LIAVRIRQCTGDEMELPIGERNGVLWHVITLSDASAGGCPQNHFHFV
jgi:hypothetical protein